MKTTTKFWIGLLVLIVLSPLGLILPEHIKAGSAWGEWGLDKIKNLVGYVPQGLGKLSSLWKAPMPDYAFKGWEEKGLPHSSFAYIVSGLSGVIIIVLLMLLIGRILAKKGD